MRNTFKALLFFTFIFTSSAQAGLLLEPYLGYSFAGSFELENSSGGIDESDYNGSTFGGRIGYQTLGLMFGADFSLQSITEDDDGLETDHNKKQLGIFIGYNAPILLRVWGTYFLTSSIESDDNLGDAKGGNGFALGAGYTGLPFVSLNVEYRSLNYDEAEIPGIPTQDIDLKTKEILLSVSLPFNL